MYPLIKRSIDIIVSFTALVLALPLLIIIALILYVANKGKPFFYQQRPGKNGRIFKIVKFKSMNDKSSLDELPQLWNVLKGDMSLIGPRPLLVSYLPLYSEEQNKRHLVKPGITGWAQVNGRNTISWDKKFEYDVWYVNHISFALDMKIYFMTLQKVIKRADISASDNTTMERFVGNEKSNL